MRTRRHPLQIHLLFHPQSTAARNLARAMFDELAATSTFPGPRIPVLYARDCGNGNPPAADSLELDQAERNLICLLADERMTRVVSTPRNQHSTGRAWGEFGNDLVHRIGRRRRTVVLPIAVDGGAFALHEKLARTSFMRLDAKQEWELQRSELFFQLAVRALELLANRQATATAQKPVAPLQVFVSHSKANLPRDPERQDGGRGAVLSLLDYLGQGPVRAWFDSSQIRPGERFDRAIERGVGTSTAFLAVRTDQYSSREWCRREFLRARELGLPIVIVDALTERDGASFPYFGSVPTVRWQESGVAAPPPGKGAPPTGPGAPPATGLAMPRQIVQVLLREALRHAIAGKHQDRAGRHTRCLPHQPDLLTLGTIEAHVRTVVYPDPPLSLELQNLLKHARPRLRFTTPMLQAAESMRVLREWQLGLSVAEASDSHRLGKGDEHLRLLVDDLSVLLLLAGAQLGYGGWLTGGSQDYTTALIDRARYLHTLSAGAEQLCIAPITNFVSWPKHLDAADDDLKVYGRTAKLRCCPAPTSLPMPEKLPEDEATGYFRREPPAGTTWPEPLLQARRFAHSRGLSLMRATMNDWLEARICVGGKLRRFSGLVPGIVEEALLALRDGKPVFLLGAFGGAARLVVDGLRSAERPEFTTEWAKATARNYEAQWALHEQHGSAMPTQEQLGDELRQLGHRGLAGALRNGLGARDNDELVECTEPFRIAELIAKGLGSVQPASQRQRRRR